MTDDNGSVARPRTVTDEQIAVGQVREVVRELGVLADLVRDEVRPAIAALKFQLQELSRDLTAVEARVGAVEDAVEAVAAVASSSR